MKMLNLFLGKRSVLALPSMSLQLSLGPKESAPNPDSLPDFVFNVVVMKGRRSDLNKLKKSLQGFDPRIVQLGVEEFSDFCLNKVIPISENVVKMNSMIVLEQFRISRWNSSTNACGIRLTEGLHHMRYSFTTGTNAPSAVFKQLIRDNPFVKFKIEYSCRVRGERSIIIGHHGKAFEWKAKSKFEKEKAG